MTAPRITVTDDGEASCVGNPRHYVANHGDYGTLFTCEDCQVTHDVERGEEYAVGP